MHSLVAYLKRHAEESPEKTAIIAEDISVSYASLWKEACGFAAYLKSFGFEKGSRIVVKGFPTIGFATACFGCHLSGYVFVPIEKTAGPDAVKEIVHTLTASMYIGDCAIEGTLFTDFGKIRDFSAEYAPDCFECELPEAGDVCDILFTTGTTGKSKGVVLSHKAVYSAVDNNCYIDRLNENSVYLVGGPINHAGTIRKMYSCILTGCTAVLIDGFMNMKKYYQSIHDYNVTALWLPPSAVRILLAVSAKELAKYADRIELVHSGAAAMPETDKEKIRATLPHSRLLFGYGASEAGNSCAYDFAEYPGLVNCIGKPNPHSRVFIVDDERKEISSSKDNIGLIAISGDTLMNGYYNEPELTESVLKDGVLYTNDMGYIDEDGFVFMLGRTGDVINVGGLKIAPVEVENVVMRFPGVSECACFGIPDKLNGFVPKLNIVCEDGKTIDLVELRSYLQKNLEMFKVPKTISFVDELPKTANGKLDRKKLQ